ncbi:MAG: Ig-like domain-containing protein [Roseburia sp.]|nr:Ig-like domain-containing protein [Roseburia sp.]
MNKKIAVTALIMAGAMSLGVIASAGCKSRSSEHIHTWEYVSDGESGHHRVTTCTSHDPINEGVISKHDDADECKCGYVKNGSEIVAPPVEGDPETPVALSEDTAISLIVGGTQTLSAETGAQWTSTDENVATVSSTGVVKAVAAGVSKVKATSGNKVVTCTVIVLSPLSSAAQSVAKNPFSFNKTVSIGSVSSSSTSTPEVSDPNASEYKVEFSNGITTQYVAKGNTVVEPLAENEGNYLTGWKTSGGADYNFSTAVTSNLVLNAQWEALPSGINSLKGNYESISVEFDGTAATSKVYYRKHGVSDSWHEIDSQLIRDAGGDVRADIMGLSAGVYDVKVNSTEITGGVHVMKYDRSGYAHFNYTDGVGAYKDDGTLKDDALVIYVTDANKDTVMEEVCAANANVNMFKIPYSGNGKDWGDKNASGIGWWLNNNQYTSNNAASSKSGHRPSNTYDATNGSKLGFKSVNVPIVIRFIGTVNVPEGLSKYNDWDEGGIAGDNGAMARMKNLKNVTLEGVGDDAEIKGWGFHFIAGTDAQNGQGKSFEVRNLTFNEYPEDAVGMEGQATSTTITAPVERCWIHNNTFLPGRCDNPAESDKKEGDGSCDFKRGNYFTCSYNYFEYCHKTNLIGSSDSSLQYNMTYHHNIWYQCGSRIPLTRRANVHFYNNFVYGDPSEKTTPYSHIAKPSLSYVHSLRASCYLYSEYNYYEGSKQLLRGASEGGDGKFYKNTYYACSDQKAAITEVTSREQAVNNSCKYQTTDYTKFDTNSTQFYYDAENKTTVAEILDDSVGARVRTSLYAGAQGHGEITSKLQQMNKTAGSSSDITKAIKGKGQVYTFTVGANTSLTLSATGVDPQVVRSDGKVIISPFQGERTAMLDAGTYMVCSGIKDKEITITSLTLKGDSEAAKKARISAAKKAIEAIPDTISRNSASTITQAEAAFNALLTQAEIDEVGSELAQRLSKAQAAYQEVLVDYAIARIEYIGEVTPDSKTDIEAANKAFAALSAASQAKVTNYNKLTAALATLNGFKGDTIKGSIDRLLPTVQKFNLITDSKPAIELALELFNSALTDYNELDPEDDKEIIKNITITPISDAIATLTSALKPYEVKELIAELPADSDATYMSKVSQLKTAYEALTAAQKELITEAEKTVYDGAVAKYTEYASKASVAIFDKNHLELASDAGFTVNGKKGYKGTSQTFTYNGTQYSSPLKLQSGDTVTFSTASAMKVTIMLHKDKGQKVKLDGTEYTANSDGLIIIESLAAGSHTIGRVSEAWLCYVELLPA